MHETSCRVLLIQEKSSTTNDEYWGAVTKDLHENIVNSATVNYQTTVIKSGRNTIRSGPKNLA